MDEAQKAETRMALWENSTTKAIFPRSIDWEYAFELAKFAFREGYEKGLSDRNKGETE